MPIKLFNTRTRSLEDFYTQEPGLVKLYTCGPTVYDYLSVGNWAAYIYWDVLVRLLKSSGYQVERVMNITDVGHLVSDADEGEDKLEKGAKREGKTAWDVAKFYSDDFFAGMKKLNVVQPKYMPKATDYINEQLDLVRKLKEKGVSYQTSDGIYFDTSQFPAYAAFAGLDLEEQRAGARVTPSAEKRHPSDFALWKFSPAGQKRDMEWQTPADLTDEGKERPGFPGWHLECSAMALNLLGNTLDIHTGGIDHIPVHHTNEIAQSETATGVRFSNFWLHNNHLKVDGTKISKSLGNGFTLDDLIQRGYAPQDFRMFVLQGHYRSEGNFTFENLSAAKNRLHHWRNIAALRHQAYGKDDENQFDNERRKILDILSEDINTPGALSIIDEVFSNIEGYGLSSLSSRGLVELLSTLDNLLGLDLVGSTPDISEEQKQLIAERLRARNLQDWAKSDEIRNKLQQTGISLKDVEKETIWQYV